MKRDKIKMIFLVLLELKALSKIQEHQNIIGIFPIAFHIKLSLKDDLK